MSSGSYIYMTFDDGPNEGTPYVLDALKEVLMQAIKELVEPVPLFDVDLYLAQSLFIVMTLHVSLWVPGICCCSICTLVLLLCFCYHAQI